MCGVWRSRRLLSWARFWPDMVEILREGTDKHTAIFSSDKFIPPMQILSIKRKKKFLKNVQMSNLVCFLPLGQ